MGQNKNKTKRALKRYTPQSCKLSYFKCAFIFEWLMSSIYFCKYNIVICQLLAISCLPMPEAETNNWFKRMTLTNHDILWQPIIRSVILFFIFFCTLLKSARNKKFEWNKVFGAFVSTTGLRKWRGIEYWAWAE